jgi:hypothetical protein
MGCLVALLALISPRLALVALWLLTDLLGRAFESGLLALVGFFLLPWTTLAYALMWHVGTNGVTGFEVVFVVLAFLADIGAYGSARD